MNEKVKKPFYKKWWVWLLAVVVIIGIGSGLGGDKESADNTITLEKFNKLENGITYEQAIEIIGSEGELLSEVGAKGEEFHTVMYQWTAKDRIANANATFQDGKLTAKAQAGLK